MASGDQRIGWKSGWVARRPVLVALTIREMITSVRIQKLHF